MAKPQFSSLPDAGSTAMVLFTLASLSPYILLGLGTAFGAWWLAAALLYVAVLSVLLDQITPLVTTGAAPDAEFPAADRLLVVLAVAHILLMPAAIWVITGQSGLTMREKAMAFFAFGLTFGQISNPAAHELIHRGDRRLHLLGVAMFVTMLFGHHASAHRLVHHRHVASDLDPNTARRGESFYAFAPRAWIGSFRAGLAAERARSGGTNPYILYLAGAGLCLFVALLIGGILGLAVYVLLAGYATSQLLLSDYVQHYGLTRAKGADNRPEPVAMCHSWNSGPWFSGAMMLHAPRHSDHHAHPHRPFPALQLPPDAPRLPWSLPVMATIALLPRQWRRVMHPLLDRMKATSHQSAGASAGPGDLAG